MNEDMDDLVRRMHIQALTALMEETKGRNEPLGGTPLQEVPPLPEDDPLAREWQTFTRLVDRLIGEGHQGRFALIKEGQPVSVWDTQRDAVQAARLLRAQEPCLVQEIQLFLRPLSRGSRLPCRA